MLGAKLYFRTIFQIFFIRVRSGPTHRLPVLLDFLNFLNFAKLLSQGTSPKRLMPDSPGERMKKRGVPGPDSENDLENSVARPSTYFVPIFSSMKFLLNSHHNWIVKRVNKLASESVKNIFIARPLKIFTNVEEEFYYVTHSII